MKVTMFLAFMAIFSTLAMADTIHVPGDQMTIQLGIDAATNGDTVLVAPGTYNENIDFSGKEIRLESEGGADVTVIDGQQSGSVVSITSGEGSGAILDGFTVRNGNGTYNAEVGGMCGCGIFCLNSSPRILNNIIKDCAFTSSLSVGGGISSLFSRPEIRNNVIRNNSATYGGGISCLECDSGTILIENNLILDNAALDIGGGIDIVCSDLDIRNCTLVGNSSVNLEWAGGAICIEDATAEVKDSICWDNSDNTGYEIGVGSDEASATLDISYSVVHGGESAVFVDDDPYTCYLNWNTGMLSSDPLFVNASAYDFHLQQPPCQPGTSPCVDAGDPSSTMITGWTRTDGVQDAGVVDMGYHYNSVITTSALIVPLEYSSIQAAINAASSGDSVLVMPGTYEENIDLKDKAIVVRSDYDGNPDTYDIQPRLTVIDGMAQSYVVLMNKGETSDTVLDGFTVTNGRASAAGGIYVYNSSPTIKNNIVDGNYCTLNGGGITLKHSVSRLENNIIINNEAAEHAGGLFCAGGPSGVSGIEIINNIVANNTSIARDGGGIYVLDIPNGISIENCTVCDNTSLQHGGGIYVCFDNNHPSHADIGNCIVYGNSSADGDAIFVDPDSTATVTYSDIEGGWTGTGNIDADPMFVNSANLDYHIKYTSPCRDAGDNSLVAVTEDIDGNPRIAWSGVVDMGADEFYPHFYCTGDFNPNGEIFGVFIGLPDTWPLGLFIGSGLLSTPMQHKWGEFYLQSPWLLFPLIPMPADGVLVIQATLPATPAPYDIPMQALIGWELSNLFILGVR